MKATLIVVEGAKPARVPLHLPTTIGRSERSKLKLRASLVSRTHCELFEDQGQLKIRDLGSSNGTKVNGERIFEHTPLSTDDMIQIGPVILRVLCDHEPAIDDVEPADFSQEPASRKVAGSDDALKNQDESVSEFADSNSCVDHAVDSKNDGPVLDAEIVDAEASSEPPVVVTYEESGEGSVIHIEEAADFLKTLKVNETAPEAGGSVLENLHNMKPDRVDSSDSALEDFFKKLD